MSLDNDADDTIGVPATNSFTQGTNDQPVSKVDWFKITSLIMYVVVIGLLVYLAYTTAKINGSGSKTSSSTKTT